MRRVADIMRDLHHTIALCINEGGFEGLEHIHSKGVYTLEGGDAKTHYKTGHALAEKEKVRVQGNRITLAAVPGLSQDSAEVAATRKEADDGDLQIDIFDG